MSYWASQEGLWSTGLVSSYSKDQWWRNDTRYC